MTVFQCPQCPQTGRRGRHTYYYCTVIHCYSDDIDDMAKMSCKCPPRMTVMQTTPVNRWKMIQHAVYTQCFCQRVRLYSYFTSF